MSTLVLIPWPETEWSAAGRIAGRTPLPLTEEGRRQANAWGCALAADGLDVVYSGDERTSIEAAEILAAETGARHKPLSALAEVDFGLWDGLTAEELKLRFPKIFKRWLEDPSSVCPPGGEDARAAFDRLGEAVERIMRKSRSRAAGVILGPLAFALVRCAVERVDPSEAKSKAPGKPVRYELDSEGHAMPVAAPAGGGE